MSDTLPCPVCRAANSLTACCRRCKADLSLLLQLETERSQMLRAARRAASAQQFADFLILIRHVEWLRSDAESTRWLAVAALLNRDFSSALRAAHRLHEESP